MLYPINQIKMDTKVLVTADEAGNVIVVSKNSPEYGHIRVEQTRMVIDDTGFVKKRKLSALIPGTVEDLKCFGWANGELVDGKVVVKESLTPFNKKDPDRDLKIAGDTGIVCCQDGQPIYRKHLFTFDATAADQNEAHTNGEDIQAAYHSTRKADGGMENAKQDFSL